MVDPALPSPRRRRRLSALHAGCFAVMPVAALAAMAATLSGCREPLLSPKQELTIFDRHDALRGQYTPMYTEDQYGRRKKNLEQRLTPKD